MALQGPGDRFLYVSGYDLMGTAEQVREFSPPAREPVLQETTGPNDTEPTHSRVGVERAGDVEGVLWGNSTIQAVIDLIQQSAGTERIAVWGLETDTLSKGFSGCRYYDLSSQTRVPAAELTDVAFSFRPNGAVEHGEILVALSTKTADGDSESGAHDGAAQSTAGGAAYLQVTNLDRDGGTALEVTVRDSSDDITYGDLVAFTALGADVPAAERVTVSGTVERYLAAEWDFTGSPGGSETATIWVGFVRD